MKKRCLAAVIRLFFSGAISGAGSPRAGYLSNQSDWEGRQAAGWRRVEQLHDEVCKGCLRTQGNR